MSTYLVFLEAKPLTVLVLYKAKREILFSRLQFDSGPDELLSANRSLKEQRHGPRMLKKLASFFKFVDCNSSLSSSVETILGYFRVFIIPLVFFYVRKLLF